MKKKPTLLKIFTIIALSLTAVTFILEMVMINGFKYEFEAIQMLPVRILMLISSNMLGGCICQALIKSSLLKKMDEELLAEYKKSARPILAASAVLVLADCIKDAFMHPETTTVSAALIAAHFVLIGIASLILLKTEDDKNKRIGSIVAVAIVFLFALLALAVLTMSVAGDLSYLLSK